MKPKLPRTANKPRFVVDVNTSLGVLKTRYGGFATFISSAHLVKSFAAKDPEIIKKANEKDYHIITHNTKDFEEAPQKSAKLKVGIICVNLKEGNYIDKFGSVLRKLKKHNSFYNKLIILGNEVKIISYSELREPKK